MKKSTACIAVALLCAFAGAAAGRDDEGAIDSRLPSAIVEAVTDSAISLLKAGEIDFFDGFTAARSRIAAVMIGRARTTALDRSERYEYGILLGWSGREDEAASVMEDLSQGDDLHARRSWRWMIARRRSAERFREAEDMVTRYRERFAPVPEDEDGLYMTVRTLAGAHDEADRPGAALRLCLEELGSLPFDAPYQSFQLADVAFSLLVEAGRLDECRALIDRYRDGLADALRRREQAADSTAGTDERALDGYRDLVGMYDLLRRRLDLIGEPAPPFTFEHVFNGTPSLSLADLRGTVVLLDFWATWCIPCVKGFEEVRRLREEFGERGFEAIGVTGFQGSYHHDETGESEGSEEEPLAREREIELTGTFVEKHGMTWPCAISDRPVFDPEYAVDAIPTYVILDREGRIRYIQRGCGSEARMRRIIDAALGDG